MASESSSSSHARNPASSPSVKELKKPLNVLRYVRGFTPNRESITDHRMGWSRKINVAEFEASYARIKALRDRTRHLQALEDKPEYEINRICLPFEAIDRKLKEASTKAYPNEEHVSRPSAGSQKAKKYLPEDVDIKALEKEIPKLKKMQAALKPLFDLCLPVPGIGLDKRTRGMKRRSTLTRDTVIKGAQAAAASCNSEPLGEGKALLRVSVFFPEKPEVKEELLVLSSNTLVDLQERITCSVDKILVDHGYQFGASYFFIENTFYEHVPPGETPLSTEIIKFARKKEMEGDNFFANYKSVPMRGVKFSDLRIRLGCHYHYCHAINDRHVVIFTDIRYINETDVQEVAAYPLIVFRAQESVASCCACDAEIATKIVYGDKFTIDNPAYYCNGCLDLLHCNEEGKLLDKSMRVYPYVTYLDLEEDEQD